MKYFFSPESEALYLDTAGTTIPPDAVELSAEEYAAVLDGQAQGKVIRHDADGRPVAVEYAATAAELFMTLRARRDALLRACDWTQMPDSPLTDELRSDWAAYRQALRDLPETVTDPAAAEWPVAPA